MGFLQRGYAYGNKRGFGIWSVGVAIAFWIRIIGVLLGGGGRIDDQVANMGEFIPTLLGGGGRIDDQIPSMLTTSVDLSLGSFP